MTSANSELATTRKTPRPTFAGGADNLSPPGNSPITPSSSQGFAISRWCDSHHPAYSASPAMNRTITPTAWLLARPTCLSRLGNELKARPHFGIRSGVPPAIAVSLAAPVPSGRDVKFRRAHVKLFEPEMFPGRRGCQWIGRARHRERAGRAARRRRSKIGLLHSDHISSQSGTVRLVVLV